MKRILLCLLVFLSVATISCKKENAIEDPAKEGPLKITKLLPLSDNIPYQALGSGKIVFERKYEKGNSSFYVIDVDQKRSTGFMLNSPMTQPTISPKGDKIACALQNSGNENPAWNIYVMNLDGSGCFPANESDQQANFPTWNQDGTKIVYYTSGSDKALFMQSPVENSPDRVELLKFHDTGDPEWSIDPLGGFTVSNTGNLVSVSTSGKPAGLIDIEPFSGKEGVKVLLSPLTDLFFGYDPNARVESPVFSPDGSKIGFIVIYTNPLENSWISVVFSVINPDGSNLISVGGMGGYQPHTLPPFMSLCWSPDATKMLFSIPDGENSCHLYVVNLDGSGYSQVTNQINVFDSNVSWSK
jgi:Tol biopolymer transport system component